MSSFKINLPQYWVLPLSISSLFILLIILEVPMLQSSSGMMIYPFDEAYIRMAIAKNLAEHGIWGLSPHEFTSASSSILYPILLAGCFKIFGPQQIIPILINLVTAVAIIVILQKWLQRIGIIAFQQLLVLLTIIYLTPLHLMVVNGMEHTLQILFSLLFMLEICTWLASERNSPIPSRLYIYGFLITSIRYEGAFLVLVACVALLLRRKWVHTGLLGIAAFLPIALFGIYSIAQNSYFIPNSVLVKGLPLPLDGEKISNFFKNEVINRLLYPYPTRGVLAINRLLILLPLTYWLHLSILPVERIYRQIIYFFLPIIILHLVFANVLLYYRYEAYLLACGLVAPMILMVQHGTRLLKIKRTVARCMAAWTLIFLIYPFFARSWSAYQEYSYGCMHEYQYNYQAGKFLHKYYDDSTVVIDELGMASFLSQGKKLDVMKGIAYTDMTRAKIDDFTRLEYVRFLIKKEKSTIALIADRNYDAELIQGWTKVAAWYTSFQLPMGETELDIYAIEPSALFSLRANLKAFQATMPTEIKVQYY
jgi:hypothetical protein